MRQSFTEPHLEMTGQDNSICYSYFVIWLIRTHIRYRHNVAWLLIYKSHKWLATDAISKTPIKAQRWMCRITAWLAAYRAHLVMAITDDVKGPSD